MLQEVRDLPSRLYNEGLEAARSNEGLKALTKLGAAAELGNMREAWLVLGKVLANQNATAAAHEAFGQAMALGAAVPEPIDHPAFNEATIAVAARPADPDPDTFVEPSQGPPLAAPAPLPAPSRTRQRRQQAPLLALLTLMGVAVGFVTGSERQRTQTPAPVPTVAAVVPAPSPAPINALPSRESVESCYCEPSQSAGVAPRPATVEMRVRAGDTLWTLAARRLGDSRRWPELTRADGSKPRPERLAPGELLLAPAQ